MGKIIFIAILGMWIFFISMGDTPYTKVYRACYPINVATSLISDGASRWDAKVSHSVENGGQQLTNWCEYSIYRTFYGQPQRYQPESAPATR